MVIARVYVAPPACGIVNRRLAKCPIVGIPLAMDHLDPTYADVRRLSRLFQPKTGLPRFDRRSW